MYNKINELKSLLVQEDISIVADYIYFKNDIKREFKNDIKLFVVTIFFLIFFYITYYLFGIDVYNLTIFAIIFFLLFYVSNSLNNFLFLLPKQNEKLIKLCKKLEIEKIEYNSEDIEEIFKKIDETKNISLESEKKSLLAILYLLIFNHKVISPKNKVINSKHLLELEYKIAKLIEPSLFVLEDLIAAKKDYLSETRQKR